MKKTALLATTISSALGYPAADAVAATINVSLVDVQQGGYGPGVTADISSSTATWAYDDTTKLLSQTGGTFNVRFNTLPTTTLFRHRITGLVIGGAVYPIPFGMNPSSASTFSCVEGNYGPNLAVSLCGNYDFGPNHVNESTVTWGPGTSTSRVLGGDDTSSYPQQSIEFYNFFYTSTWDGTTLVLSNSGTGALGPKFQWTLEAAPVPIPAAAWLFGGALCSLGWIKRKQAPAA